MDGGKEKYIQHELSLHIHSIGSVLVLVGAGVTLLLSILDYFVTPENFTLFFTYRLIAATLLIALGVIFRLTKSVFLKTLIIIIAALIPAAMVELMIFHFGGHQSIYYVGIIIIYIFILGFLPTSFNTTLLVATSIYAIYLLPLLFFDTITNTRVFINNNVFIISSALIVLVWRHINYKLLVKNLSLQYDLAQDKNQLEIYSQQLEKLVQERTKELSVSEKWHRSIFDNATDGIIVLDRNGVIVNANQRACEITGFDRDTLIGTNVELIEGRENKAVHRERMSRILDSESLIYEINTFRENGGKVVVEVSSRAIGIAGEQYILSFYRDVTEKKSIQEQLIHSQKMESIGILAGGIAHNFNNILTAILGYAELLLEFSKLDDDSKQKVRNIENSARKASIMIAQMLKFARREPHEVLTLNLHDVINDTVKLFEGASNKKIKLSVNLDKDTHIIKGDPNQIEQVIMNLLVNAKDAMPDGGLITISTRFLNYEDDRLPIPIPPYIAPGRYVVLSVTDTGCGIPQEVMNNIFDPFFTTKNRGKGTGLGLATVYGIVKDHKGYIHVHSDIAKGTTFDIYLPAIEGGVKKFSMKGNRNRSE